MKVFNIEPNKCSGCHLCELVCSFKHYSTFSAEISNIRIESIEDKAFNMPVKCMQCEEAYCIKACVAGALYKDYMTGAVKIDQNKCIGCKACVMACPFGAVNIIRINDRLQISICDLCSGDPECVKVCRGKALTYIEEGKVNARKRSGTLNRIAESSEGGNFDG
ncbi:4Fe-4S dicluster domain-containing protein [Lutispora sp.]|uniref:4Fe-4S dicluster domain-containing protein n=1 Tax=Lutispora sp. TaxID=2828727 RepID=UPI0035617650